MSARRQANQITAGQGQDDSKQVKKLLGYFAPGRATAGWDNLEIFRLTDASGNPLTVNLGGNVTGSTELRYCKETGTDPGFFF